MVDHPVVGERFLLLPDDTRSCLNTQLQENSVPLDTVQDQKRTILR